ncbi:MAG: uroporphyrinogen decarboxylase family protein [Armatimonadota bacterium]
MTMTSRERVRAALNFQEPDQVPVDCSGMRSTGIAAVAYGKLKQALGLDGEPPHVYDVTQMLAEIEEPVRRRFGFDIVPLEPPRLTWQSIGAYGQWKPQTFWDGSPLAFPADLPLDTSKEEGWYILNAGWTPVMHMPRGGNYFDSIPNNTLTFSDAMPPLKEMQFGRTVPDEDLKWLAARAKYLYEETPYSMLGWGYGFCSSLPGIGWEDWMCLLMTEPDYCSDGLALAAEAMVERMKLVDQAVGDYVDVWGIAADDMGTQRGEYVNPEVLVKVVMPHYKTVCQWFRQHSRMKTFLHSCGSIYHLIEPLIDAGLDCLNPVQTSAANMDPAQLKREFGGRIVFWGGGADTQWVLGNATPEEVDAHVRERIQIFAPGGGFIFTPVHNVQANVPPENIIACYDAVKKWGRYPI